MDENNSPKKPSTIPNFKAHIFVCTNSRKGGDDCLSKGSAQLRENLKALGKTKWGRNVRVNSAGCLGQCDDGIAAVCYPSGTWALHLKPEDVHTLEAIVDRELATNSEANTDTNTDPLMSQK